MRPFLSGLPGMLVTIEWGFDWQRGGVILVVGYWRGGWWLAAALIGTAVLAPWWLLSRTPDARAQDRPVVGPNPNSPQQANRAKQVDSVPQPPAQTTPAAAVEQLAPRLSGAGLELGQPLPVLPLYDVAGKEWDWTARQDGFQVYIGGCITCQIFLDHVNELERLADRFARRGVQFHYVQPRVTHAEVRRLTEAYTLRERLRLGTLMTRELGGAIPWLIGGPGNAATKNWRVYHPNFELVVAPSGELLRAREWSDPDTLRDYLTKLLSSRTDESQSADSRNPVGLQEPSRSAADPRPRLSADVKSSRGFDPPPAVKPLYMPPLKVEPEVTDPEGDYPLKLRAEVQRPVLKGKSGQWFLRWNVDPTYEVTWPARPLPRPVVIVTIETLKIPAQRLARYELSSPAGPRSGAPQGWRAHPLEHLADAPGGQSAVRVRVTATLENADGQPMPVQQNWIVRFEELPD